MKKKISDIILNVIIAVLTLSMLTLLLLYAARSATVQSADSEVFDKLWIVQDYEDTAFASFTSSLCTPELIAYKQSEKDAGISVANEELTSTVYSVLSDMIIDIFGADSVCISEGIEYSSAVRTVTDSDSYIFFEYSADIPFPYIYAFSSAQSSVDKSMCANGAVYISKIAFLLEENENGNTSYICYAFDSENNAYMFEHADGSPYTLQTSDKIHLDAYYESIDNAEFLANTDIDSTDSDSLEFIYGTLSYSPIQSSNSISFLSLDNGDASAAFLELFELNPEKLNSYVERDGTTVFIGTDERLTVSPNKTVEFTSDDEAIPLNKILGYTPSNKGSYTLFDMLKATDVMINRFRTAYPEFIGKSAQIKLTGVYKDAVGGNPVFEYSYFYNGVRIDTGLAFRFVFNSEGICELSINLTGFTVMSEKRVTLSKETAFNRILLKLTDISEPQAEEKRAHAVRPLYTDSGEGLYTIVWAMY